MLPLIERPPDATVFLRRGVALTAARFSRDAQDLAASLPSRPTVAVLCQDRYRCAVAIAASVLRGQVCLMSGDPTPELLRRLAGDYPDTYAISDDDRETPFPVHRVDALGDGPGPGAKQRETAPLIDADQPAMIVLTSGTTGGPVGTRKNWGELVARTRAAALRFGLDAETETSVIGTVPPGHMYGLETTVLLPLHAPVASWCEPVFFPADIDAALRQAPGPRWLVTTPTHLAALLRAPPPSVAVAHVISATAPLAPAIAAAVERDWSSALSEILGASEVGSIASRRTVSDTSWTLYPGVRFEPDDADGVLVVAPHAERRPFRDVIEREGDGTRFRLLGRREDLVKRGGRRASLEGLTALLRGLDGVEDAVFIAPEPYDDGGRLAALAVAPTRTERDLLAELRPLLDPLFLPRPLRLVPALPRNRLGKLPRAALLRSLSGMPDETEASG